MKQLVLLLGGNLGNRKQNFQKAIELLESRVGRLLSQSGLYESEPWGFEHENNFLNQVLLMETELRPEEILSLTQNIEKEMGRIKLSDEYEGRFIDIDILFYDDLILHTESLIIPHKHLHERRFTLLPLHELMPDFVHPKLKLSIRHLLSDCKDKVKVWKVD